MFVSSWDLKESMLWKKIEMFLAFWTLGGPLALAVYHGVELSKSLSTKYHLAGIANSPYFPGKSMDLHDGQLRQFLDSLPLMTLVAFSFIIGRKILKIFTESLSASLFYYVVFGLGYALYIHGPGVLFSIFLIIANYALGKSLAGAKGFPVIVWLSNLGFLILAEYYHGFEFSWISSSLRQLDKIPTILNWYRVNNFMMLKIVSFLIDYHWKVCNKVTLPNDKHRQSCDECSETVMCLKYRTATHAEHYSLSCFISYCYYPPLYLAGPILSYNGWISQVITPQNTMGTKQLLIYIARFFIILTILMWFMHYLYFPAIANMLENREIFNSFNAYELSVASFCILKWIWLKFTMIWRYCRIWALLDGIESPENMGRCMCNCYGFEGFWRMWHRSFNQWLVRYLFIPLGGSKYKIYNVWVVFGFVALWHDLRLHLLVWGWGMCIFIVPEVLIKAYFNRKCMNEFRKTSTFWWLSALGAGIYFYLMIVANLIGFSFGLGGLKIAMTELFRPENFGLLVRTILILTGGANFMFLYREDEARRGIKDKGY